MAVTARERRINRVLFWLALLSGKPHAMGTVLIAEAQEERSVAWDDVRGITVYRRPRVITLAGAHRTLMRLSCPPELFDEAAARCHASLAAVERLRRARGDRAPRPWTRWAMAAAAIALVTLLAALNTWPDGELSVPAAVAGLAAVVALPLPRRPRAFVSAIGLAVAAGALMVLAVDAWQFIREPWGGGHRAYRYESWWLVRTAASNAVLLAVHLALVVPYVVPRRKEQRHDSRSLLPKLWRAGRA